MLTKEDVTAQVSALTVSSATPVSASSSPRTSASTTNSSSAKSNSSRRGKGNKKKAESSSSLNTTGNNDDNSIVRDVNIEWHTTVAADKVKGKYVINGNDLASGIDVSLNPDASPFRMPADGVPTKSDICPSSCGSKKKSRNRANRSGTPPSTSRNDSTLKQTSASSGSPSHPVTTTNTPKQKRPRDLRRKTGDKQHYSIDNPEKVTNAEKMAKYNMNKNRMSECQSHSSPNSIRVARGKSTAPPVNNVVTQLSTRLAQELRDQSYDCTVCYDAVGRKSKVWSCGTCYMVFHLSCISQWAKANTISNSTNSSNGKPMDEGWRCPGCQSKTLTIPSKYRCFCGQVTHPEWDPYSVPHTCGNVCKRRLDQSALNKGGGGNGDASGARKGNLCTHKCSLLCHPGPCPPCELYTVTKCLCGVTTKRVRCDVLTGTDEVGEGVRCEKPCLKLLDCSKHECMDGCHAGRCKPCALSEQQHCYCGQTERTAKCGDGLIDVSRLDTPAYFACDTLACERPLKCGKHRCKRKCHPGECYPDSIGKGDCSLSPENVSTCACGKEALAKVYAAKSIPMRAKCDEPIPTCDKVCMKPLPCARFAKNPGAHKCKRECHDGECTPCADGDVRVSCVCGSETRSVSCKTVSTLSCINKDMATDMSITLGDSGSIRCKRMCQKKLNCKRHICEERCCPMYKRASTRGYAGFIDDSAHECHSLCNRMLTCALHSCSKDCHDGPCPPCFEVSYDDLFCLCGRTSQRAPIPCNSTRPICTYPCTRTHDCDHPVRHECHSQLQCPPCVTLVDRRCMGGHEVRGSVPCHVGAISCGAVCGHLLQCSHSCNRICHKGPCVGESTASISSSVSEPSGGSSLQGCGQPCGRVLSGCGHKCLAACHLATPCPTFCAQLVDIQCGCGLRTEKMSCAKVNRGIVSNVGNIFEGNTTDGSIMDGLSSHTRLPCNERCAVMQRNFSLAHALDIDVSTNSERLLSTRSTCASSGCERQYPATLIEAYQKNADFILTVENFFASAIKQYQEGARSGMTLMKSAGSVKSVEQFSCSFGPFPMHMREVAHTLAHHYALRSESVECGKRYKVAVTCDSKSFVPGLRLSQVARLQLCVMSPDQDMLVGVVVRNLPLNTKMYSLNSWASTKTGLKTSTHKIDDRHAVILFMTPSGAAVEVQVADRAMSSLTKAALADGKALLFKSTWNRPKEETNAAQGPSHVPDANGWIALTKKGKTKNEQTNLATHPTENRFNLLEAVPTNLDDADIPDTWESVAAEDIS